MLHYVRPTHDIFSAVSTGRPPGADLRAPPSTAAGVAAGTRLSIRTPRLSSVSAAASRAARSTSRMTGTHIAFPAIDLTFEGSASKCRVVDIPWRRRHSCGVSLRPLLVTQCPSVRANVRHGALPRCFVRNLSDESQSMIHGSASGSPPSLMISSNTWSTARDGVIDMGRRVGSSVASRGSRKSSMFPWRQGMWISTSFEPIGTPTIYSLALL